MLLNLVQSYISFELSVMSIDLNYTDARSIVSQLN